MSLCRWLSLTILALPGCRGPEPPVPLPQLGCFVLTWSSNDPVLVAEPLPDSIRLAEAIEPYRPLVGRTRRNLVPLNGDTSTSALPDSATVPWHRQFYVHWWEPLDADSVLLFFSTNSTWWTARLSYATDVLTGTASMQTDVVGQTGSASIRGHRIACG